MLRLLSIILIPTVLAAPTLASDFNLTTGSVDYLSKIQETSTLTHLRDVGGTTPRRAIACISYEKYEQYLYASAGNTRFYPTKDECWPTDYNQFVKATGTCFNASDGTIGDYSYKTLVCEFATGSWFSSNVWISAIAVVPK